MTKEFVHRITKFNFVSIRLERIKPFSIQIRSYFKRHLIASRKSNFPSGLRQMNYCKLIRRINMKQFLVCLRLQSTPRPCIYMFIRKGRRSPVDLRSSFLSQRDEPLAGARNRCSSDLLRTLESSDFFFLFAFFCFQLFFSLRSYVNGSPANDKNMRIISFDKRKKFANRLISFFVLFEKYPISIKCH